MLDGIILYIYNLDEIIVAHFKTMCGILEGLRRATI
jgi:hypothetical protein